MSDTLPPIVHFGGPDRPPRLLRSLLRERIDAVGPGGEIVWATYYFRDRDIALALISASDRGVRVTLRVEGRPRREGANDAVLAMLDRHGLNGGLNVYRPWPAFLNRHLHSKIYYFSDPVPTVFTGSFNPSGDEPEDPEVIAEIGDQDRGHNLLVEFHDARLAHALKDHVCRMDAPLERLRNIPPVTSSGTSVWFYPRFLGNIAESAMSHAGQVRGCISHLKAGPLTRALQAAANRGARVRLLVHATERRVPGKVVQKLQAAGVDIRRFDHPDGLPMHAKFLLFDQEAWFGSYNFNPSSRWLNREILVSSCDPEIVGSLERRFEDIAC